MNDKNTDLAHSIFIWEKFQKEYIQFLIESTRIFLFGRDNSKLMLRSFEPSFLISCGSILAQSSNHLHLDAALRIASFVLQEKESSSSSQKTAAIYILRLLTNSRGIRLAITRQFINSDFEDTIPSSMNLDFLRKEIEGIAFSSLGVLELNSFQKAVYQANETFPRVSISAPTSAGKSFILYHCLLEFMESRPNSVVTYLVPTRALIQQVQEELRDIIKEKSLSGFFVSSIPTIPETEDPNIIFVFTQERLTWMFSSDNPLKMDFLIVDEAHNIQSGSRGIVLQNVIEQTKLTNPGIKILYASPGIINPELFLEGDNSDLCKTINSNYVAVNQNVLWIQKNRKRNQQQFWELSLAYNGKLVKIHTFETVTPPKGTLEKLAFFAYRFKESSSPALIYVNSPKEAEQVAQFLYELVSYEEVILEGNTTANSALAQLVRSVIHQDFLLAKVVDKKIGFHYGNMPQNIRVEIEESFREGRLKYLICTSTLLDGVNLPASSIFLLKPSKVPGKPLGDADFWNLAGRAGRLGKEFQGNVICIDPDDWNPPKEKLRPKIERAIKEATSNKIELLDFIKMNAPRSIASKKDKLILEYAFCYLFNFSQLIGEFTNQQIDLQSNAGLADELKNEFKRIQEVIQVPPSIYGKHLGISPIAQNDLLIEFGNYSGSKSDLIPMSPRTKGVLADSYIPMIMRINKFLSGDSTDEKRVKKVGYLTLAWMSGQPIKTMIQNELDFKGPNADVNDIARTILGLVEYEIRYKFLKYSMCYLDILAYYFKISQNESLIDSIPPNFKLQLEFGLATKTQFGLLQLGFSRFASIELSGLLPSNDMNTEQIAQFLVRFDPATISTKALAGEYKKVIKRLK